MIEIDVSPVINGVDVVVSDEAAIPEGVSTATVTITKTIVIDPPTGGGSVTKNVGETATINWTLPNDTLSEVRVYADLVLLEPLPADATSYQVTSSVPITISYTITVLDQAGNESAHSEAVTCTWVGQTGQSYLADQVAQMVSGEWRQIHSLGDCFFRMYPECEDASLLQYLNNAAYDQNNWVVTIGSAHGGGMEMIRYDITNDIPDTGNPIPLPNCNTNCSTHGYDHTAFDHVTGLLYYADKNTGDIYTHSIGASSWTKLPNVTGYSTKFKSFNYFPPTGKFILAGDGKVYEFDQLTNTVNQIGTTVGGNHSIGDFSFIDNCLYYCPGKETSAGSRKLYKIDENYNITQLANAPIYMRIQTAGKGANLTASPDGGVVIIDANDSAPTYKYNSQSDSWSSITGPSWTRGAKTAGVLLQNFGVNLYFHHSDKSGSSNDGEIWLHKP